ncbi:MAG: sigma-70 family RNA polymerase sigma factor [Bacteroidales bacterium]|jgi:RNA polymerase sigma factor (sigma-70 family)|nr:sigma-70 family RNA polymerase sigma factor [Bacteroidales bacterium]
MRKNKNHRTLSDEQLLNSYFKSRNAEFIGELWNRYSRLIFGLCLKLLKSREEATDAVNGIFEKLMKTNSPEEIACVHTWIYTFSKNHCLQILRKKQRRNILFDAFAVGREKATVCFDEKLFEHEALRSAISELSEQQKTCIRLFYFNEFSYQEISDETGWATSQIKSYLQNGKRNLKLALNHLTYENN